MSRVVGAEDGYDDDRVGFRPPPPLDDRLWRHPAEVSRVVAPPTPTAFRRSPWALGLVTVVGGAVLAGSLLLTAGGIGDEPQRLGLRPLATLVPNVAGNANGIVSIRTADTSDVRTGNGMVLGDGIHVVTSLQLVAPHENSDPAPELRVFDEQGVAHRGEVVARDAFSDLAIIRTDGGLRRPRADLPEATLTPGSAITALGGGRGAGLRGWANEVDEPDRSLRGHGVELVGVITLARSMPAVASGAVVLDREGNFAGMVSVDLGGATTGGLTAVIVPAERIRRAVEQYLRTGTITHGWLGVEAPVPADTTRRVALRSGAAVEDVVVGSPAGSVGIRAGDVLMRVCGHEVASIDDVLAQMLRTAPGTRCMLELVRDGAAWYAEATVGERIAA